jgi:hypothetical protein
MARETRRGLEALAGSSNDNKNNNNNVIPNVNNNVDVNKNKSDNISNNTDKNNTVNENTAINANVNEQTPALDYLDNLIGGNAKKTENNTVLTGIYLQKDLAKALDNLAKKGGRGAKSRIVNEALRAVFKEKGLL